MLYRVTFLCKESKLGAALAALRGKITGKVEFDYITGHPSDAEGDDESEVPSLSKIKKRFPSPRGRVLKPGEGLPDRVAALLITKPPSPLTTRKIKELTVKAGGGATTVYHITKTLKERGILSELIKDPDGGPSTYKLNPEAYKKYMEKANEEV